MSSQLPYFVPTRFVWRFGGKQVHLCGSFTRWVETVPMIPVEQSPGMFAVLVHLPPGYHQYKFIVDGEWRHDETQPFMPDPLGNVNNWLYVRQPDAAGAVPIGMHMPQATSGRQPGAQPSRSFTDAHQRHPNRHNGPQGVVQPGQQGALPATTEESNTLDNYGNQVGDSGAASEGVGFSGAPHGGGPGGVNPPGAAVMMRQVPQPSQQAQQVQHAALNGSAVATGGQGNLVELGLTEDSAVLAPIALHEDEPSCTRKKVHEFLASHTAYELIPESGKVVLIDYDFSIRRAFHALAEQGIASAPLWDRTTHSVVGMISASDFIETLKQLREAAGGAGGGLTDTEMDAHSIRALRQASAASGAPTKPLVYCHETDSFATVVRTLVENRCSMAPILSSDPAPGAPPLPGNSACGRAGDPAAVLHVTSLSGVLASLMRHFRASWASLPLLAQPLASMPLGTWSPDSPIGRQGQALSAGGVAVPTTVTPIHTVQPNSALTTALSMLMEAGVSSLPVVDQEGVLLDIYARSDITLLTRGSAYLHLQMEDMSVGQALQLASASPAPPQTDGAGQMNSEPPSQPAKRTRLYVCTRQDQLRLVLERLSMPAVRRVIVVHPETSKVEGIISLSDVARFLFL